MTEKKKEQTGLLLYSKYVQFAKLDLKAKALLWFYAHAYGWNNKRPSYFTQEQICAYVGFSPNTYQKTRNRLEELGWIKVIKNKFDLPLLITPMIGEDDEGYDLAAYSKGHKRNKNIDIENLITSLAPEDRDPFWKGNS